MIDVNAWAKNVEAFGSVLSEKPKDKGSNFAKEYIKLLVDEIRVDGENVRLKGSYDGALAGALKTTKPGHPNRVPSFGHVWLPMCNPFHNGSRSPAVNLKPL